MQKQAPTDRRRLLTMFGGVAALALGFDQATKALAVAALSPGHSVPLLGEVVHLSLVHNTGGAFGLPALRWVLIAIGLLCCFAIPVLVSRSRVSAHQAAFLALIWAGSAGNLLDRLHTGAVTDFIDLRVWPVFNVADIAITVGFVVLALALLKRPAPPAPTD